MARPNCVWIHLGWKSLVLSLLVLLWKVVLGTVSCGLRILMVACRVIINS